MKLARLDLDLDLLAGMHEADVTVGELSFDGQLLIVRDHDHQALGGRYDAADGVHR